MKGSVFVAKQIVVNTTSLKITYFDLAIDAIVPANSFENVTPRPFICVDVLQKQDTRKTPITAENRTPERLFAFHSPICSQISRQAQAREPMPVVGRVLKRTVADT